MTKIPINADYCTVTEKTETNPKVVKLKLMIESKLLSIRIFFNKGYTKIWSREILIIHSVLKSNPWTNKLKDLTKGKIIWSSYEKESLLSKL